MHIFQMRQTILLSRGKIKQSIGGKNGQSTHIRSTISMLLCLHSNRSIRTGKGILEAIIRHIREETALNDRGEGLCPPPPYIYFTSITCPAVAEMLLPGTHHVICIRLTNVKLQKSETKKRANLLGRFALCFFSTLYVPNK